MCLSDTLGVFEWHLLQYQHIVALLRGPLIPDLQNWIKSPSYIQRLLRLGGAWSDLTLLVKVKACWLLLVAVSAGYIRYRVTSPSIAAGNEAPHKGSQSRRLGPSPG